MRLPLPLRIRLLILTVQSDPDYILIKKYINQKLQDELFEHTRALKSRRQLPREVPYGEYDHSPKSTLFIPANWKQSTEYAVGTGTEKKDKDKMYIVSSRTRSHEPRIYTEEKQDLDQARIRSSLRRKGSDIPRHYSGRHHRGYRSPTAVTISDSDDDEDIASGSDPFHDDEHVEDDISSLENDSSLSGIATPRNEVEESDEQMRNRVYSNYLAPDKGDLEAKQEEVTNIVEVIEEVSITSPTRADPGKARAVAKQETLQLRITELNAALEKTIEEYRLSSAEWRDELGEARAENQDLRSKIERVTQNMPQPANKPNAAEGEALMDLNAISTQEAPRTSNTADSEHHPNPPGPPVNGGDLSPEPSKVDAAATAPAARAPHSSEEAERANGVPQQRYDGAIAQDAPEGANADGHDDTWHAAVEQHISDTASSRHKRNNPPSQNQVIAGAGEGLPYANYSSNV